MAADCSSGVTMTSDHMGHIRSHRGHRHANHRKSAVELLEASKSVYVKSSEVLNQRQELKHPEILSIANKELITLTVSPVKNSALEDVSNILSDYCRRTSEDRVDDDSRRTFHGSTGHHDNSSSQHSTCQNDGVTFKKPVAPSPHPPPKPAVPPKPACVSKPGSPPTVGPKPVLPSTPSGKPVPPPRSTRKLSGFDSTDSAVNKMSSSDQKSVASTATTNPLSIGGKSSTEHSSKRYSSVSASASISLAKDHGDTEAVGNGPSSASSARSRESRYSVSSQSEGLLKPLCSSNLSTSVGILVEKKRSPVPNPKKEKHLKDIDAPTRRQLHRSHSDLSSCRHSRASSDFSDLSSRLSRTSTEVERFFNEMGIDRTVLEPMRRLAETKHKDFLDSLSSLDSIGVHSLSSRLSQNDLDKVPMESEPDLMERSTASGSTSVVERNARIIKWLCNVKKARAAPKPHTKSEPSQSSTAKKS